MPQTMRQLNNLEQAIYSTIAYFDIFSYPLTLLELYKWLYYPERQTGGKMPLSELVATLNRNSALRGLLREINGFYFLVGREKIIRQRLEEHNLIRERLERIRKFARLVQLVPFVLMVGACNNVAIGNINKKSDLDVLLVVRDGRIWLTRFLTTALTYLAGMWRHGQKIAGRICLSFYVTDRAQDLEVISKRPYDIYLLYWTTMVLPVFDRDNAYQKFIKSNDWIKKYLPNFLPYEPVADRITIKQNNLIKWGREKITEFLLQGKIGDGVEKIFRRMQLKKMHRRFKKLNRGDRDVVVNDTMLKFHENDRRIMFRQEFERRLALINKLTK